MQDAYTLHGFALLKQMQKMDAEILQRMHNHDRWAIEHQHRHAESIRKHHAGMDFVHPDNKRRRFNGR